MKERKERHPPTREQIIFCELHVMSQTLFNLSDQAERLADELDALAKAEGRTP